MSDFFTEDDIARTYGMGRLEKYDFLNGLILERSKVVYARMSNGTGEHWHFDPIVDASIGATHQARLIMIEPIEVEDNAVGLLEEMTKHSALNFQVWSDFMIRARKLLNKQGGK